MTIIRIFSKVVLFPISLALSIITLFLTFVLGLSTIFFRLISFIAIMGFLGSVYHGEKALAIEAIVLAYLFSPYGLPVLGYIIIEMIERVNEGIKSI
ncbi:MAG: CD1845 family protein [Peptoniphilaceae bacterium]